MLHHLADGAVERQNLLRNQTGKPAAHVGRGDVDEHHLLPAVPGEGEQLLGPQGIEPDGSIERRVEDHGGRIVDDEIDFFAQLKTDLFSESQFRGNQISLDRNHLVADRLVVPGVGFPEAVEDTRGEKLLLQAFRRREDTAVRPLPGPDEHVELPELREVAQNFGGHSLPQKTRDSGEQNRAILVEFSDHRLAPAKNQPVKTCSLEG